MSDIGFGGGRAGGFVGPRDKREEIQIGSMVRWKQTTKLGTVVAIYPSVGGLYPKPMTIRVSTIFYGKSLIVSAKLTELDLIEGEPYESPANLRQGI